MLKDLSRIHNREQQESWSSSTKKRRKKKVNGEIVDSRGGDTLDLSHTAQYLAFFKNIDFQYLEEKDSLYFELKATGENNAMIISGDINIHSLLWKISWLIKSELPVIEENELLEIIYSSFNSLKRSGPGKTIDILFSENESKNLLSDTSNELTEILKELLTFIQQRLPLKPNLKGGIYTDQKHFEPADKIIPWPHCFNRTKVISINFKWTETYP